MPRTSKKTEKIKEDLAALVDPAYVPTTTLERDAPANIRKLEYDSLKYGYEAIQDAETRSLMQDAAVDINQRRRRAAEDIFHIGARLLEIQDRAPDEFWYWVQTEFDYAPGTAREFMNIALRFADDPERILDVPYTVLRYIARPTVPDEAVDAVLEAVEEKRLDGGKLKVDEALDIIDEHKPEEAKRPRRERIARTIAGTYSVEKTDDPIVKTLVEAPPDAALAKTVHQASKPQLEKALSLLSPDDTSRRQVLEFQISQIENKAPAPEEAPAIFQAPAISTRKKNGVLVELPRALWGKVMEAFRQFDMNPVISDKESSLILKTIEQSLERQ